MLSFDKNLYSSRHSALGASVQLQGPFLKYGQNFVIIYQCPSFFYAKWFRIIHVYQKKKKKKKIALFTSLTVIRVEGVGVQCIQLH